MSWLGDHINSITEKISDFTKEVLPDNIEAFQGTQSNSTLREKNIEIEQLREEKEILEKNIEELDAQHQEAINELLHLKNELVKENNELKFQLLECKNKLCALPDKEICVNYESKNKLNCVNSVDAYELSNSFEIEKSNLAEMNVNLLTVLSRFKNWFENSTLELQITQLENAKKLIIETESDKKAALLNKIDIYISYLKFIGEHKDNCFPFMQEVASVIEALHIENKHIKQDLCNLKNLEKDDISKKSHCVNLLFSDSETQTEDTIEETAITLCTQYSQTDSCETVMSSVIPENFISLSTQTDKTCNVRSIFSQTDSDFACNQCTSVPDLQKSNNELQLQIKSLQEQILFLKKEVNQVPLSFCKSTNTVSLQTDNFNENNYEELKKELIKSNNELKRLENVINENQIRFQEQQALNKEFQDCIKMKDSIIVEKNLCIDNKNIEIQNLRYRIDSLKEKLNHQHSNQPTRYDDDYNYSKISEDSKNASLSHDTMHINFKPAENVKDTLCMSVSDNEKLLLQEKLKALNLEKSRLLCVLNEKSQECSNLKTEVHRLTNIVASEKKALLKLQQDNQDLKQVQNEYLDPELTKEAVQKLSRLIRDKDIEIEALKQKNSSLSAVLQQTTSAPDHIQSLMEEQENLVKQINLFKSDREKIMISYNAKDQECRMQQIEIKRLNLLVTSQSEKIDILQQQHHSVAQQYEEKQKSLIDTQNEMIVLKQRVTDLEQEQINIKEKYSELLDKINNESMISITKDEYSAKLSEIETLKCTVKSNDELIHEKDCIIHELSQHIKNLKLNSEQHTADFSSLKKENAELLEVLKNKDSDIKKMHADNESLNQKLNDKQSELTLLKEMNERLSMHVKEKEFAIQSMDEKIASLSEVIHGNVSSGGALDVDQILLESENMYSKAQQFHKERDETLLALSQSQQECQDLKSEIQRLKNNEDHLKNELNRLRQHLLQIEENYTADALKAEEREKELRNQLADLERTAKVSTSAVFDASQQANIQVASLQEQVVMIANQRDRALEQLSGLEDKVQQYAASLNNLQLVLDQMQKGHDQKVQELERKWKIELQKTKSFCHDLENELQRKQIQLQESTQALEAASRLSEQLDSKEEIIAHLKYELQRTENLLKSKTCEINSIKNSSEGKVDRIVLKSLVLGYFSTPPGQKSEVVRLLARVLDFNQEEMEKAGIVVGRSRVVEEHRGIISSFLGRLPSLTSGSKSNNSQTSQPRTDKSFTALFVQFLENESQPIVPMPLPAEKMARELTSKSSKHSQQARSASPSGRSPLLLDIASSFPTFTPVPAVEYSSSPAPTILQEVLE